MVIKQSGFMYGNGLPLMQPATAKPIYQSMNLWIEHGYDEDTRRSYAQEGWDRMKQRVHSGLQVRSLLAVSVSKPQILYLKNWKATMQCTGSPEFRQWI